MPSKAPYRDLDSNIVVVCKSLNRFRGIYTIGSCGGHADHFPYQLPEGTWQVLFRVTHDEHGWFALEFLTWLVNNHLRRLGHKIVLDLYSAPPYLNEPGKTLYFDLWSASLSPGSFARQLEERKAGLYLPPSAAGRLRVFTPHH